MSFTGPKNIKKNGGLGRKAPSNRNVGGLVIAAGYAVGTNFPLGSTHQFHSLAEAEALGLGADTDANNAATCSALPWYHISEYFRLNPDGVLWVRNETAATASTIFSAGGIADQLFDASSKAIRYFGIVLGGAPDAVVTVVNGMDSAVTAMQAAAQQWVADKEAKFMYIDNVVIEGKSLVATAPTLDLHTLDSPQVSICVGNDLGYLAEYIAIDPGFGHTAAVGTFMASVGVRKLSECIGSVDIERKPANKRGQADYTLVDTLRGRWIKPGLSSGVLFDNVTPAIRKALSDKGYIHMGRYDGYPGVFLNDSDTAEEVTSDFCKIENNRVWNEAARYARATLIPRMNSTVDIDPETGYIDAGTIASWVAAVKRKLETLMAEKEISAYSFSIEPNQNVLAGDDIITLMSITPRGIARGITNELGFVNPYKL